MAPVLNLRQGELWKLLFGLFLVGFAYLWHVDTPMLWGDEAGTAVFSKNVIKEGIPLGFDGRNLSVFGNCASVSHGLLSRKIPWVQYYIGSLSILLFGQSTMGVRLIFVLIGVCSFFPLHSVLKKESNHAALITTLVLLSPQVVLFQRNARYYPIVILLFSLLLWTYSHEFYSQKVRLGLCCILSILFFHTHELAAFCVFAAYVIFGFIKDRGSLKIYLPAFLLGFGSWLIFYLSLKSVPGNGPEHIQLLMKFPAKWFLVFLAGIKASIVDLDYINALPLLAWGLLFIFVLLKKDRRGLLQPLGSSIGLIILISIGIQIILNSALVGFETAHQYSLLRYMPHLVATLSIPLFLVLERVVSYTWGKPKVKKCLIPVLLVTVVFSNVFTLSYWMPSLSKRSSEFSWWPPVYLEILEPKPDPFRSLIETMAKGQSETEQTVFVWPPYVNEILNFYVGDKYLIIPSVLEHSPCEKAIVQKIGSERYNRFKKQPKWIVLFLNPLKRKPAGYELNTIPFIRHAPDATRPELTRHDFHSKEKGASGYIYVYERL